MSKFNTSTARARNGIGPITTTSTPVANHNGGVGYLRDEKSELFLAVVNDFAGEKTFYESAENRTERIRSLVHSIARTDLVWLKGLAGWLRNEANMRSISLTIALEGAKALNEAGIPGGRKLVSSALLRADEPGEALGYWFANFGRKLPISVKRGIADAVTKAYSEYSLAKYDTPSHGFRFADVIELVHPTPKDGKQNALFRHALERRRDVKATPSAELTLLNKRAALLSLPIEEKKALLSSPEASTVLSEAGLTWEALAGSFGTGGLNAKAWEALIPSLGYMALLRNLRNFEKTGVSESVLNGVATRLADPDEVAKSRQLPFRFLSAHRAVSGTRTDGWGRTTSTGSLRFGFPLEQALNHSLANVPSLTGNTLILVDRSGSMFNRVSDKTELTWADTAALFGSALAVRAERATLVEFGSSSNVISYSKYNSVLSLVNSFRSLGGTDTAGAVRQWYRGENRVILLTDEQYYGQPPLQAIPANVPVYTFNLAGYRAGSGKSGPYRTYLGGLSDQSFKLIPLLEAGRDAAWPWIS